MTDLRIAPDGLARCAWVGDDPEYARYHDEEWGRPLHGDRALFEKMSLEGFQAGLSWITILRKRPRFREVFAGFDPVAVAAFTGADVDRLMGDAGIIRNRLKVDAAIHNAQVIRGLRASHGSFAQWLDAQVVDDNGRRRDKAAWVKLFKKTFRFTGGEITNEFLMSLGYLPGAHREDCPAFKRAAKQRPPWMTAGR